MQADTDVATMPSVSVRIRQDQYDAIKAQAAAGHRSIASQLQLVISAGLKSNEAH